MIEILAINEKDIKDKIHTMRGVQVIIDRDLAFLYNVQTKVLNQAVKRNIERFPKDFMFQLTENEKDELVTICDHLGDLKYSYNLPYVFTEQGVAALSGVLRSDRAVEVHISVIRAFVSMRRAYSKNILVDKRLDAIERKQLVFDSKLDELFSLFEIEKLEKKQGVFFENSVFDAHMFISDLLKKAKKSIILIDNYVDYNTLVLFSSLKGIEVTIYTRSISERVLLDVEKFNTQFKIEIKVKIIRNTPLGDKLL